MQEKEGGAAKDKELPRAANKKQKEKHPRAAKKRKDSKLPMAAKKKQKTG
jgi:hypothetical protein